MSRLVRLGWTFLLLGVAAYLFDQSWAALVLCSVGLAVSILDAMVKDLKS